MPFSHIFLIIFQEGTKKHSFFSSLFSYIICIFFHCISLQVFKIEYYTDSCKYSISFFQSCFIFFIRSFVQTSFSRGYFVLYFSGMFFYSKVKYWLIFMIPLIHSTTFFFIPMMFLFRFMNPYMNKKSIIIMLLFVIILSNYQSIASLLLTFISGKSYFQIIFCLGLLKIQDMNLEASYSSNWHITFLLQLLLLC